MISTDVVLVATDATHGYLARFDAASGDLTEISGVSTRPSLLDRTPDGSIWYGDDDLGLYRSKDAGLTFNRVYTAGVTPWAVAVHPADLDHIFMGTSLGLYESGDGGESWTEAGAPFGVRSLAFDPSGASLYVGTILGGVYRYSP